jgi:hypothetical protein
MLQSFFFALTAIEGSPSGLDEASGVAQDDFDPYETRKYRGERAAKEEGVQVMQEGQTIKHDVYGLGIVTSSDGERTAVDFDDHGPKLFVTSIMTAELIGEAPATPPKTKRRRKASTAAKAAKAAKKAAAAANA